MAIVKIGEWSLMGRNTIGVTIWPFIFLRKSYFATQDENALKSTINHETIHIRQQGELLVIFFYFWYFIEWAIKFFKFGNSAYNHISFELEAYENEGNYDYLKTRKFWSFLKYVL